MASSEHSNPERSVEDSEPTQVGTKLLENPFKHSTSLLEIIPQGIDVEEESRLYDELCDVRPPILSHLAHIADPRARAP